MITIMNLIIIYLFFKPKKIITAFYILKFASVIKSRKQIRWKKILFSTGIKIRYSNLVGFGMWRLAHRNRPMYWLASNYKFKRINKWLSLPLANRVVREGDNTNFSNIKCTNRLQVLNWYKDVWNLSINKRDLKYPYSL